MDVRRLDLVNEDIPFETTHDFGVLIFVLSAISPEHFPLVAKKIYDSLNPGGVLFFRDYGKYDLAQIRFAKRKKNQLGKDFYMRSD
jgi:methyltransferase-like protein 6